MRRTFTTFAATLTAAGLVVVAAPATTALARGDGDTPTTTAPAGQARSDQPHDRPHRIRRVVHRVAARAAAESIGVSVQELRDAVLGGQTVAAFAEAKGVDPATVEAAIATALQERVDEAVSNGRITEERAATAKDHADEVATRLVNTLPRRLGNASEQ